MFTFISKWIDDFLFTRKGIVQSIDLTFGGAGNQNMRISGKTYATWIDFRQWPKIGSTVYHRPYYTPNGRGSMLLATDIVKEIPRAR